MTTQRPDLKKLREVTASLPDEASVNVHIAKLDEMFGTLAYCSFEHVHSWAILKLQISQLIEANPSALLDAYEASARDADQFVKVPADKFALMRKALHRSAPIPEVIRTFPESRKEHEQIYAFAEELERMYTARQATQGD